MSKYNYFDVVNVDGYDFPIIPQASFRFNSKGISFLNRGSKIVQYSFDGHTVHGDLDPNDASIGITSDNRVESKVWFRGVNGYSTVRVEAWGK